MGFGGSLIRFLIGLNFFIYFVVIVVLIAFAVKVILIKKRKKTFSDYKKSIIELLALFFLQSLGTLYILKNKSHLISIGDKGFNVLPSQFNVITQHINPLYLLLLFIVVLISFTFGKVIGRS